MRTQLHYLSTAFSFVLGHKIRSSLHLLNYEGFLIPGLPHLLEVVIPTMETVVLAQTGREDHPKQQQQQLCQIQDLTIRHVHDGLTQGRWKVMDMVRHKDYHHQTENSNHISLSNYQQSWNSIGVVMDYQFRHCRLLPLPIEEQINPFRFCTGNNININNNKHNDVNQNDNDNDNQEKKIHIILIGDSVM